MKIEKYKCLGKGKYKVIIDKESYIIYEDVILKHNILNKDNIDKKELNLCLKDNSFYEAYYKAISYINIKLRSSFEIKKYLVNNYSPSLIDSVVLKLKEDGYLDEKMYTEAYINDQINLKIVGPIKIKSDLLKLGISDSVIDNCIGVYTKDMMFEKINKVIEKEKKINRNKSNLMIKNKILYNLKEKGFYSDDIKFCLHNFVFNDSDIYKKEYDKLYKRLSIKYSGSDLEYKIKEKLYQKGFRV